MSNDCICFICRHSKKKKSVGSFTSPLIGPVSESYCVLEVSPFSSLYIIQKKKKQGNSSSQTIISFDMGPLLWTKPPTDFQAYFI